MSALLSVIDAARELGVIPQRVRQLIANGTLPATKVGHAWVIEPRALERARRRRTIPGPAPKPKRRRRTAPTTTIEVHETAPVDLDVTTPGKVWQRIEHERAVDRGHWPPALPSKKR